LDAYRPSSIRYAGHRSIVSTGAGTYSGQSSGSNAASVLIELAESAGSVQPEASATLTATTAGALTLGAAHVASVAATAITGGVVVLDEAIPGVVNAAAHLTATTGGAVEAV